MNVRPALIWSRVIEARTQTRAGGVRHCPKGGAPKPQRRAEALTGSPSRRPIIPSPLQPDWPAVPVPPSDPSNNDLLRPREVAGLFGVRPTTIARWAREGKLMPFLTPGGHRRYSLQDIRRLLGTEASPSEEELRWELDAARLCDQGWGIRQVAKKFDCIYGVMRRILRRHTTLRGRGGKIPPTIESSQAQPPPANPAQAFGPSSLSRAVSREPTSVRVLTDG
jgi:MerR HTH family regulatory protein